MGRSRRRLCIRFQPCQGPVAQPGGQSRRSRALVRSESSEQVRCFSTTKGVPAAMGWMRSPWARKMTKEGG